MSVFDQMGFYWSEIADQNQTERQLKFLRSTLRLDSLVLDVACGTGRHLIPLTKEGFDIVGLDISSKLLTIAKNRLKGVQLVRADMRHLPFKPHMFTAALSMDTSLGYLPTEPDDMQTLLELREALTEKGIFVIDVFNRSLLTQKYPGNWRKQLKSAFFPVKFSNRISRRMLFRLFKWREYPSFFLLQKRTVRAHGSRLHDLWVICDKANGQIWVFRHIVKLYQPEYLKKLIGRAGFLVNRVFGDYEQQQFNDNSNRLILIANAK